jgi:hypothetical protein
MNVVVITGAGASCNLGLERPLPVMAGWADRLCDVLEGVEPGLAAAAGLRYGLTGEKFEETLGALLRWQELRPLNRRFTHLGGSKVGKHPAEVEHAFERESGRLQAIMASLHHSLYDEFGASRISMPSARAAFAWLLDLLPTGTRLTIATTNYDRTPEMVLPELGYAPNTGFVRRPGCAPKLAPDGLVLAVANTENEVAVIHLHGAVGWYQQGGEVIEHYADQPFRREMGVPAVLYPDPDKDPTRDAAVRALWNEFDHALDAATHVLVLGHSLHDTALARRIRSASARVGVCVHAASGIGPPNPNQVAHVKRAIPRATVIPCDFGPQPQIDKRRFESWLAGATVIEIS